MSQVDDWSDGYTSDYLRDLNTYGPASANVPRPSSVVSHQVRYRAPDTSDIPLAPGQNPEDSVYSNASGARMGQTKPRSGYNPPAGGGYTAQTFPSSGAGAKRYARPKPAVKKKTQSASKQRPQPEYRTGGARTPEENEITRSAAEHRTGADLGQLSSQALDAAARFRSALKLLGFGAGAGSADTASTDIQQDDIDRAYDWTATGNAGTGGFSPERPMVDSSDAASGIPPEIMARLKKDADDGSPWGLLPWALGPIYKPIAGLLPAGQKIAGLLPAGQKLLPAGQKLLPAGQKLLPAGQKLLPAGQKLLPYNGEAAAGAVGSKAGEAAAGDAAAGAGSKSSFRFDLSPEEIASAKASHDAYVRGVDSELIQHIRSGTLDEMERAWIEAMAAGAAKAPGTIDAATQAILNEARAAGILGRDAAGTAGTGARGSFRFDLSPEEIASAKASHDAYVRGTAGAADGGVSELANAANAGRGAAGADAAAGAAGTAGTGARGSFRFDLSPEEIASAKASHDAYVRGTAGAADGGVSELANAGNVGRETAAGAAGANGAAGSGAGHVDLERAYLDALNNARGTTTGRAATGAAGTAGSGAIDSTTKFLIKQIKTGKLDNLERAWIDALADRGARNPQLLSASEQALLNEARAAGILGRDAAGTAGAARGASQGTVAGAGSKARWDEIPDANGMTRSRADEVLARGEIERYDPRTTREGIARYIEDDLKTLAGKPGYETPYQAFQTLMSQWSKYNPDLGQDPYNYIWRLAVRMFE